MSELKIGLIYIRQSRHKDSERTVSPEVQEGACRALPAIQGCDRVEGYVDLDKSGKSIAKRPTSSGSSIGSSPTLRPSSPCTTSRARSATPPRRSTSTR